MVTNTFFTCKEALDYLDTLGKSQKYHVNVNREGWIIIKVEK